MYSLSESYNQNPSPQAPPPADSKPLGGIGKSLTLLLGLFVGLLLCGTFSVLLILSGQLDQYVFVAEATVVEPTWTATPRPSATPSASATPPLAAKGRLGTLTPTRTSTRVLLEDPRMLDWLMKYGGCSEAILILDRMIAARPDDSESYIKRAKCYLELLAHLRSQTEYVDYVSRALADADKAIALGTATADYYTTRANAYANLASISEFNTDSDGMLSVSEENVRIAIAMGALPEDTALDSLLLMLGRCDEFLELVKVEAVRKGQKIDAPDAYWSSALGRGYVCKGELDKALKYMDSAIKQEDSSYRKWTRTVILYNMGRLEDALAQLNELIKATPYGGGDRYYLRALVYYDLKKPDLARQDITFGTGQTWGRYGLRSYVLGKLALDAGDRTTGIELIRLAEATLARTYGPLFDRIRQELKKMGVQPLAPTPSFRGGTPIPTPTVTLTPRPTVVTSKNFPPPSGAFPLDYTSGTGKIRIERGTSPYYRFQPGKTVTYASVQSLTFYMSCSEPIGAAKITVDLWKPRDGGTDQHIVTCGDNPIPNPDRYVSPDEGIYVMIGNWGDQSFAVDNTGFTLTLLQADGTKAVYGLKQK